MKLVMHCGSHKTGSSSVQHAMHTHRRRLLEEYSILYPETFLDGGDAHHQLALSLRGRETCAIPGYEQSVQFEKGLSELRSEIEASRPEIVVVSSEELYYFKLWNADLFSRLCSLFDDVVVVVYVREPCAFLESSYKFSVIWSQVREKSYFLPWAEAALRSGYFIYPRLDGMKSYDARLKLECFSYDEIVAGGVDIAKHFLASVLVVEGGFPCDRVNERVPLDVVLLSRLMNAQDERLARLGHASERLVSRLGSMPAPLPAAASLVSERIQAQVMGLYAKEEFSNFPLTSVLERSTGRYLSERTVIDQKDAEVLVIDHLAGLSRQ